MWSPWWSEQFWWSGGEVLTGVGFREKRDCKWWEQTVLKFCCQEKGINGIQWSQEGLFSNGIITTCLTIMTFIQQRRNTWWYWRRKGILAAATSLSRSERMGPKGRVNGHGEVVVGCGYWEHHFCFLSEIGSTPSAENKSGGRDAGGLKRQQAWSGCLGTWQSDGIRVNSRQYPGPPEDSDCKSKVKSLSKFGCLSGHARRVWCVLVQEAESKFNESLGLVKPVPGREGQENRVYAKGWLAVEFKLGRKETVSGGETRRRWEEHWIKVLVQKNCPCWDTSLKDNSGKRVECLKLRF